MPFAAVAAANCVNIPLMRQNEITKAIEISDENGNKLTKSKVSYIDFIIYKYNIYNYKYIIIYKYNLFYINNGK